MKILPLTQSDFFVVLATDGILDVLSDQEIVDLAGPHAHDPVEASKMIVRTAYKKGSEDNLTAMVVQFAWADEQCEALFKKKAQEVVDGVGVQVGGAGDDVDMFA